MTIQIDDDGPYFLRGYNLRPNGTLELVWEREIVGEAPAIPLVFERTGTDPDQTVILGADYYGTKVDDAKE